MSSLPPRIGLLASGARDAITDVPGVTVGHCTLAEGDVQTGVTVVRPHAGDPYRDKVPAAAVVLNGFGKSVGLVQLHELGVLETPIALTNTYSVSAAAQAQIRQCIAANPESGRSLPTVNPLVFECNDGFLNDIQRMAVQEVHYAEAAATAGDEVGQGAVGAGRGMSCFGLKGGIGSASRRTAGGDFTVGALVLANFGKLPQLVVAGQRVGERLARERANEPGPEKGSIILLLATDAPLDARQLRRVAMRAAAGLARTGSVFGHGSGDIALAFSTAYTVPHLPERPMPALPLLHETRLDDLFEAAADACEQSILHALWRSEAVTGRDGHHRDSLGSLVAGRPSLFQTFT
ncbi:P1 family peptidase [Ramlibacter sp. MMS24-I3-19]|uniref:DmpA family aminopeptidase n=1 Tax=Ramlibacter sp. MMS24-I3-19 TaxID=3416606 RepID=UPI003D066726